MAITTFPIPTTQPSGHNVLAVELSGYSIVFIKNTVGSGDPASGVMTPTNAIKALLDLLPEYDDLDAAILGEGSGKWFRYSAASTSGFAGMTARTP